MRKINSEPDGQSLREKLIAVIVASDVDFDGELTDDTSLIKSGLLDSSGLFNVAMFIESEVGHKVDIATFDLAKEWDTINDILGFIRKLRGAG